MNCATYEKGEGINLEPGQKPGAKLLIKKKDGLEIKGELIAVKENSLLLKESGTGVDVTIEAKDVNLIFIKAKSMVKLTTSIGFTIGCLVAIPYTGKIVDEAKKEGNWYAEAAYVMVPLVWGALGALIGLIVAVPLSKNEYVNMRGKSKEEIKKILDALRKKAKVPDFQ